MKLKMRIGRHEYVVTTDHAASSYGQPVVLRDGELTDVGCTYHGDDCNCSILGLLADVAGVHSGPATRRALAALCDEMYPDGVRTGADADRVIAEFVRRGVALRAAEDAE